MNMESSSPGSARVRVSSWLLLWVSMSGQGMSFTGAGGPGSNNYPPAASNSYQLHATRMPAVTRLSAATTYGSHFQLDAQLSSPAEYNWNSSYNSDYADDKFAAGLTDGWSFDYCN